LVLGLVAYVVLAAFWFTPTPAAGADDPAKAATAATAATGAAAGKFDYVGSAKCAMCHKSDAKGNQLKVWQGSPHAKAYATLQGEKAKAIATEKKLAKPAHESPECLKCHATAAMTAAPATAKVKLDEGVSCESCHGAGSAYQAMNVMKAIAAGTQDVKAVGFVKADAATCTKCHNDQSPTFKGFKYEEHVKKIAHPDPTKKK
jgi:hypothetical protein